MSSEFALQIDNVAKTYHLYDAPQDRLKQMLFRGRRQYFREYQALKPLSFSLPKGEVLGVVGRNGAGKSTLLQLICGTLTPSQGQVHVRGRIAALLELGAGFNPQFTGRENIYLSASIMGISRQEVDSKVEEIIDFAGVRNFIDQPVSTYSSGMYVRLAFSVATSIEPDILIIDEALSVGDGDFARRSFERIMAMKERGATILFCSHSLYQIEVLCSQAIWIEKGELIRQGTPAEIVPTYQAFLDLLANNPDATPADLVERKVEPKAESQARSNEYARIEKVIASSGSQQGDALDLVSCESDLNLAIHFKSTLRDETPQVALVIHNAAGQLVTSCGAWTKGVTPVMNDSGEGIIHASFPQLPLLKGTYYVGVLLFCQRGLFLHDEADPVVTLNVTQPNQERGIVMLPHEWSVPKKRIQDDATVTKRQPSDRWTARPAQEADFANLKELFQNTFNEPLHEDTWHWKYKFAESPGYLVEEGDQVVGFCGGAPRRGLVKGQTATFVQLGDVMVDRRQRGVLTKTGPFYRSINVFSNEKIGKDRQYAYAFGFPNKRHLRVGERQHIYVATDRILEAAWPALASKAVLTPWQGETHFDADIERLWGEMAQGVDQYLIGLRDLAWLKFRYLEKPHDQYQCYLVQDSQQSDGYQGVIVLKDHPDAGRVELLDFVALPEQAGSMVAAAQQVAHEQGRQQVMAWLTQNVYQHLEQIEGSVEPTDVYIPGNANDEPEHLAVSKDSWWLMGGDSDFR